MLYIFDMGGVVTNTSNEISKLMKILGTNEKDFFKWCGCPEGNPAGRGSELYADGKMDLMSMASNGEISIKDFWRIFSARSGIAVTTDWWHWLFHPVLNQGTVQIIKKLKQAGNRVVCGTNTIDSHYQNHLERGDYLFFDQTYASNFMGVSKPSEEFWKIILVSEGVNPEDAVFIDDRKENVEAAAKLGIKSHLFESAEKLAEFLNLKLD